MKKTVFFAVILFSLAGFCELSANIDNLSNMSAEWIRTGNRNAATDAADIVVYNPGGVTELADGFQIDIGNQMMSRKPKHTYDLGMGEENHEQENMDWVLPNIYVTYNRDNWAVFGGYYISGGGAVVDYPDGSITTDMIASQFVMANGGTYSDEYLKAISYYNTFIIGGAYKINDVVSIAAGARYLLVTNCIKAGFTSSVAGEIREETEEEGNGFGAVAGVNLNLTKEINLGIQYQSQINLNLRTDVKEDTLGRFTDGEKNRRDLPAILGLGLGYDITNRLYVEADYTYTFQENCNWGKDSSGRDISSMAGDAQSAGIMTSYSFLPELLASIGAIYTDFMWNDINGYYEANTGSYEVLYSDNLFVGGGVAYTVVEGVVLNIGIGRTFWKDQDLTNSQLPGVTIKTSNRTTNVAVGLNINF